MSEFFLMKLYTIIPYFPIILQFRYFSLDFIDYCSAYLRSFPNFILCNTSVVTSFNYRDVTHHSDVILPMTSLQYRSNSRYIFSDTGSLYVPFLLLFPNWLIHNPGNLIVLSDDFTSYFK